MLHSQKFNRFVTKKPNAGELYVSRNMDLGMQLLRHRHAHTATHYERKQIMIAAFEMFCLLMYLLEYA